MRRRIKLKWKNIGKAVIFLFCLGFIIYDLYMLLFYPFISKRLMEWTFFGFITFIGAFWLMTYIFQDFERQIKNVSNTGTVKHTNK